MNSTFFIADCGVTEFAQCTRRANDTRPRAGRAYRRSLLREPSAVDALGGFRAPTSVGEVIRTVSGARGTTLSSLRKARFELVQLPSELLNLRSRQVLALSLRWRSDDLRRVDDVALDDL